ncbi:MAG: GreA/GreB family elongation factor, partial [Alphaproteobacteria bacterium]|nr:GreA/GreB family elongation factor [Alphaproteobacteria bacterium]
QISRAEVIDVSKLSGDTVKFGATVTLSDEDSGEEQIYQLVGAVESDIKNGLLSITAPLARALIGKSVGDSVEVATPRGAKQYEIIKLSFV